MSEARDTLFIPVDVIDQVESALNAAIGITLMHAKTQQPAILAAAIALTEAINNQPDLAALRALQAPAIPAGWLPIESAPKDDPISSIAYKATDKFGNVCHFGVRSLAEVWAKGGTVEEVPSRNLIVITGIRGQPLPPPPEKDTKP